MKDTYAQAIDRLTSPELMRFAAMLVSVWATICDVESLRAQGFTKRLTTASGHTYTVVSHRSPQQAHRRLLTSAKRASRKE